MTAGRRNTLVEFQTYTTTQNAAGEETPAWSTVASEWAAVFYGRGDERRQAAMERGAQPAVFQVLSNNGTRALGVTARLTMNPDADEPDYWDIIGIAPDTPARGLIEFTATRAA